jgi:hypothetical protein
MFVGRLGGMQRWQRPQQVVQALIMLVRFSISAYALSIVFGSRWSQVRLGVKKRRTREAREVHRPFDGGRHANDQSGNNEEAAQSRQGKSVHQKFRHDQPRRQSRALVSCFVSCSKSEWESCGPRVEPSLRCCPSWSRSSRTLHCRLFWCGMVLMSLRSGSICSEARSKAGCGVHGSFYPSPTLPQRLSARRPGT